MMTDNKQSEREREIRATLATVARSRESIQRSVGGHVYEEDLSWALGRLTEERAAHAKTREELAEARAEVAELRRQLKCCKRQKEIYFAGFEQAEKDCTQARRDAVWLNSPKGDPPEGIWPRIATYREALPDD
jgi:hypothetical protein